MLNLLGLPWKREKKPVQTRAKKPKLYTFFLTQSMKAIYDWQEEPPATCFARALLQGRQIVRIQIINTWPNPESILKSFREFEFIAPYELVGSVPCNDVWE